MENNEIYQFLKKNNLTTKDESSFLKEYSDPKKAEELHKFFVNNELTTKDSAAFYDTYLKKKGESQPITEEQKVSAKPAETGAKAGESEVPSTEVSAEVAKPIAAAKTATAPVQKEFKTREVSSWQQPFQEKQKPLGPKKETIQVGGTSYFEKNGGYEHPKFTDQYNIAPYATDPNHEKKVSNIYNKLYTIGALTPSKMNDYIKKTYPNSPITGEMINSTAQKYGVDPVAILALIANDSSAGKEGKAVKTLNPGNVGNDDTGKLKYFKTWDEGVDAVGDWLSKNKIKGFKKQKTEQTQQAPEQQTQQQIPFKLNEQQAVIESATAAKKPADIQQGLDWTGDAGTMPKPKEPVEQKPIVKNTQFIKDFNEKYKPEPLDPEKRLPTDFNAPLQTDLSRTETAIPTPTDLQRKKPEYTDEQMAQAERIKGTKQQYYDKANELSASGDNVGAMSIYLEGLKTNPNDPDLTYGMGYEFQKQGDNKAAIEEYKKILKSPNEGGHSRPDMVLNAMSNALLQEKDYKAAEEAAKKALSINTKYEIAYLNLANSQLKQGKDKEAEQTIKIGKEIHKINLAEQEPESIKQGVRGDATDMAINNMWENEAKNIAKKVGTNIVQWIDNPIGKLGMVAVEGIGGSAELVKKGAENIYLGKELLFQKPGTALGLQATGALQVASGLAKTAITSAMVATPAGLAFTVGTDVLLPEEMAGPLFAPVSSVINSYVENPGEATKAAGELLDLVAFTLMAGKFHKAFNANNEMLYDIGKRISNKETISSQEAAIVDRFIKTQKISKDAFKFSAELMNTMPKDMTYEQRKTAFPILLELNRLREADAGLDPAFQKENKKKMAELEKQLQVISKTTYKPVGTSALEERPMIGYKEGDIIEVGDGVKRQVTNVGAGILRTIKLDEQGNQTGEVEYIGRKSQKDQKIEELANRELKGDKNLTDFEKKFYMENQDAILDKIQKLKPKEEIKVEEAPISEEAATTMKLTDDEVNLKAKTPETVEVKPIEKPKVELKTIETPLEDNIGTLVDYEGIEGVLQKDSDGNLFVHGSDGSETIIEGGLSGKSATELGVRLAPEKPVIELKDEHLEPIPENQIVFNFDENKVQVYGKDYTYEGTESDSKGNTTAIRVKDDKGKIKFLRNPDVILEIEIQKEIAENPSPEKITPELIIKTANENEIVTETKTVEPIEGGIEKIQQEGPVVSVEKIEAKKPIETAFDILQNYEKGTNISPEELNKKEKPSDTIIGKVFDLFKNKFNQIKIAGKRSNEGAAFYDTKNGVIEINKNSNHWKDVQPEQLINAFAHEFTHHLIDESANKTQIEAKLSDIKNDLKDNKPSNMTDAESKAYDFIVSEKNSPQEVLTYAISNPETRGFLSKYAEDINNVSTELIGEKVISNKDINDYKNKIGLEEQNKLNLQNGKESKPAGNRLFIEPITEVEAIANGYYERVFGKKRPEYKGTRKFDREKAKKIADAFDKLKHDPNNPKVKAAYEALVKETAEQYQSMLDAGYEIEVNNNEPYSNSQDMIDDLKKNKRIKIFSTESGFGSEAITDKQRAENPLLRDSGFKDKNGLPLLNNDVFRAVHDFFGHSELGNSFGFKGEENAYQVHARMFSPLARKALATETRGQNSFVNFSGINDKIEALRDEARKLRAEGKEAEAQALVERIYEEGKFADQKIGLLPDEFIDIDETDIGDEPKPGELEPIEQKGVTKAEAPKVETLKETPKTEAPKTEKIAVEEKYIPKNKDLLTKFEEIDNIAEKAEKELEKKQTPAGKEKVKSRVEKAIEESNLGQKEKVIEQNFDDIINELKNKGILKSGCK